MIRGNRAEAASAALGLLLVALPAASAGAAVPADPTARSVAPAASRAGIPAGPPAEPVVPEETDTVFTVVLEGGTVHDGRGGEPVTADVGIVGDRIAAIGDLSGRRAGLRLDVTGLSVVPGFIDLHSHAASRTPDASDLFRHPQAESYLRQGVTTVVGGQDGSSPYPVGEYLARLAVEPAAVNFGTFVGHGTVRLDVMGNENRPPADEELRRMEERVATAMEDGAFGLSSGLEYTPGSYAETAELVALARVAASRGGIYSSHIRNEGAELLESVREVIAVAEEADLPGHVTHHKVVGPDRFGRSAGSLRLLDEAAERGVDVTSDVYPYAASSTGLSILFPTWSREGTGQEQAARLRDPDLRSRIEEEVARHIESERGGDPSTVVLSECSWDRSLDGMSLADVLRERGRPATPEEAARLAVELRENGGCRVVLHSMSEEDVERIMRHEGTMIGSDAGVPVPGEGVPHPRAYGTFARVLGVYARERGVLSFAEAVRKMSGQSAARLGLPDRGVLRPGAVADVTVLDPDRISDRATFAQPHQYAVGVRHVFVAGRAVLLRGEVTGVRPGRVLRRQ